MDTKVLQPNSYSYDLARKYILAGDNVAFPTETVYGLGANAFSDEAVARIYEVKGRAQDNPLIVHFADPKDITDVAIITNDIEKRIIDKCMPGPISLVLKKKPGVCTRASCGLDTVACRVPENKVARDFIHAVGVPICAPSANLSKRPSPTTAQDVYEDMGGKIPLIIDGGECTIGIESTVVRVVDGRIYVLRPGKYSATELEKIIGVPVVTKVEETQVPVSPGTKYSHYCPRVPMCMVKSHNMDIVLRLYQEKVSQGLNPIILCDALNEAKYNGLNYIVLGSDSESASKNLFSYLRRAEKGYDYIIAEFVDRGDMQEGLYNRMCKAASGNIID